MAIANQATSPSRRNERFPVVDLAAVVAGEERAIERAIERAAADVRAACDDIAFFSIRNTVCHGR